MWFFGSFRRRAQKPTAPETPGPPKVYATEPEWQDWMAARIENLPWFGEDVPLTKRRGGRPGRALSEAEQQLVLLSWLVEGSAAQKAERVGVGRRSIYRALHRVIYTDAPDELMGIWADLGLIVGLITPRCLENPEHEYDEIVCLVCHQVGGAYNHRLRELKVGQTFRPDPLRQVVGSLNAWAVSCAAQAHLVGHFMLAEDPLQQPPRRGWFLRGIRVEDAWSRLPDLTVRQAPYAPPLVTGGSEQDRKLRQWRARLLAEGKRSPPPR